MPDWSYRPLMKPWMLRVSTVAHAFVLRNLSVIGRTPLLYRIVDLLGHMAPSREVRCNVAGIELASPVGLSATIDSAGRAFRAFERFGVGLIEHGPLGPTPGSRIPAQHADLRRASIIGIRPIVDVAEYVATAAHHASRCGVARFIRLAETDLATARNILATVEPYATAFILPPSLIALAHESRKPCGVVVRMGEPASNSLCGAAKFLVLDPAGDEWSPEERSASLAAMAQWRSVSPDLPIVHAAGGVTSPIEARETLAAGASAVLLSHGFVHTGPGLPKRINDVLSPPVAPREDAAEPLIQRGRDAWVWALILGCAMTFGGVLAIILAMTSVILPYDEAATGLSAATIAAFNERLVHFMSHDRMTLAGTMLSLGALYIGLAIGGMRRGQLFAKEAVALSSFVGHLTFLAFVGYGYFDQFHAFVAAVLFPIAIQVVVGRDRPRLAPQVPDLYNDTPWRLAAFGQLTFVMQGVGLLAAGATITTLGMTSVFVDTDLAFLGTDASAIHAHHASLVPLVAHDRASFGGMLIATGCGLLVTALWGFQRGAGWLWWTLTISGFPAYLATLWIHASIGYTDALHLSPVVIGLCLHIVGVVATRPYLAART